MEYKILIENQLISKELVDINKFLDFNKLLLKNGYTVNEYYVFDLTNNLVSKVFIKNIKEPKFISIDKSLRTPKFHNEESLRITNELFNLGSVPQQFTKFNNQLMNNQLVYDDLYKSVQPKQYTDYITELTKELTNNGLRNKLFLNWLIKDYKVGNCLVEDLFVKGIPCIIDFNNDNIKNILSEKGYSLKLTDYKVNELYGIIENIKATEIIDDTDLLSKRMICRSGNWVCVSPLNYEESVSLSRYGGTITSWCTAVEGNDTYFKHYTGIEEYGEIKNPLFIFLNLDDPNEKYQANLKINEKIDDNNFKLGYSTFKEYLDEKYDIQFMDINDHPVIPKYGYNPHSVCNIMLPKTVLEMIQIPEIKKYLYCQNTVVKGLYSLDKDLIELTENNVYDDYFLIENVSTTDSDLTDIKGFKHLEINSNKPNNKVTKFSDNLFIEKLDMSLNNITTKNMLMPKTFIFDDSVIDIYKDYEELENQGILNYNLNPTLRDTEFKIPDIEVNTNNQSVISIILTASRGEKFSMSDNVKLILPKIQNIKGLNKLVLRIRWNIELEFDVSNFYESYLELIKQGVKIYFDAPYCFYEALDKYLQEINVTNFIFEFYQLSINNTSIYNIDNFSIKANFIYAETAVVYNNNFLICSEYVRINDSTILFLKLSNETGIFNKIIIHKNSGHYDILNISSENVNTINHIEIHDRGYPDIENYTPSVSINVENIKNLLISNSTKFYDKLLLNLNMFNVKNIEKLTINIPIKYPNHNTEVELINNYQNIKEIEIN